MDALSLFSSILLSSLSLLILASNISVFIAVYQNRSLQTRANALLLCLASSDFLVALFNIPLAAVSCWMPQWRSTGSSLCTWSGFFEMTFLIASVFSVTAINVNRCVFLTKREKYYDIFSNRRTAGLISAVWLCALILSSPPLLGLSKISYKVGKSHCFVDWKSKHVYTFALMIICFFLPVTLLSYCYYKIYQYRELLKKDLTDLAKRQAVFLTKISAKKGRITDEGGLLQSNVGLLVEPSGAKKRKFGDKKFRFREKESELNGDKKRKFRVKKQRRYEVKKQGKIAVEASVFGVKKRELSTKKRQLVFRNLAADPTVPNGKENSDVQKNQISPSRKSEGSDRVRSDAVWLADLPKTHLDRHEENLRGPNTGNIVLKKEEHLSTYATSTAAGGMDAGPCPTPAAKCKLHSNKNDRKLELMCFMIVASFFVSWFPFVVTMFIEAMSSSGIPAVVDQLTLCLGYLNSLLNPLIYCYFQKAFRRRLALPCCRSAK